MFPTDANARASGIRLTQLYLASQNLFLVLLYYVIIYADEEYYVYSHMFLNNFPKFIYLVSCFFFVLFCFLVHIRLPTLPQSIQPENCTNLCILRGIKDYLPNSIWQNSLFSTLLWTDRKQKGSDREVGCQKYFIMKNKD